MRLLLVILIGLAVVGCKKYPKPEPIVEDPDVPGPTTGSGNAQTDLNNGMTIQEILNYLPVDSLYGTMYQGGLIFFVDVTDYTGLVASVADQSNSAEFGCTGTLISGANGVEIGTGAQNTEDIIAECTSAGIAAEICANLSEAGYDDWFLPSQDELNNMYWRIGPGAEGANENIGGFATTHYWTSSELQTSTSAYGQYFGLSTTQTYLNKSLLLSVRAVRAF